MMRTQTKAADVETASAPPKVKRSQQTRQRILDAAAMWLNRDGLAMMSLQDLANEVGLQTASLYYHFPSKDALIEEVMEIGMQVVYEDVRISLEQLGPEASYRERIHAGIRAHLSSLLAHGDYTSANLRNFPLAPESIREKNLTIRRKYADLWRRLLLDAQRAGEIAPDVDLTLIRLTFIGALNWSTEWFNPRKKSIDTIADVICNMLFDGIGGQGKPAATRAKARRGSYGTRRT
jgi:AcrR family transcriptional regulator